MSGSGVTPNFHEVQIDGRNLYLIMDYIEGGTLKERIKLKRSYSEKECVKVMRNILKGIEKIHKHGVIHHDIKANNIVLSRLDDDCDVKIIDFGLTCAVNDQKGYLRNSGTLGFMAPELFIEGQVHDQKADVFSIGCCFYLL